MDKAKIRLSSWEAELVSDPGWILTKNAIMGKARLMLEEVQAAQMEFLQENPRLVPAEVRAIPPKISRGEYYLGLPYLILDYPRQFQKEGTFAIRTMFWWGHFFSITLHVSGEAKDHYLQRLETMFAEIKEDFSICINEQEWEHHFDESNYRSLSDLGEEGYRSELRRKPFVKLARRIPLRQWEEVYDLLLESFSRLLSLAGGQLPRR
jgi:hypothetical protein